MREQLKKVTASVRSLTVAEMELDATIEARSGNRKKGFEMFRGRRGHGSGVDLHRAAVVSPPVVEGWATTAMALGDYGVAEQAYRTALAREPGSGRAYFGIAAALRAQNRLAEAQAMEAKGRQAWDKADADLPQLRPATSSAAGR